MYHELKQPLLKFRLSSLILFSLYITQQNGEIIYAEIGTLISDQVLCL